MTEGIIDKVIRKHLQQNEFKTRYINLEHGFEQELKAEIEKEFHRDTYRDKDGLWGYPEYPSIEFVLERLLGNDEKNE